MARRADRPLDQTVRESVDAAFSGTLAAPGPPAQPSDAEAVHDFRKAMKRWRAILQLFAPFLGDEGTKLRLEARDLARELAGARDVRAALEALDDLAHHHALSQHSISGIKSRLEALGAAAESTSLTEPMRQRLRQAIKDAASGTSRWPLDRFGFAQVAGQLTKFYRRARKALPANWAQADPLALHELRKLVVVHRYQMELMVPLWPKVGRIWVAEAQKLRDRLGQHHDLTVLLAYTAPHQPLAWWRSRLRPAIGVRQTDHVAAAARLAGRLFAESPKAFHARLIMLWEHQQQSPELASAAPTTDKPVATPPRPARRTSKPPQRTSKRTQRRRQK
jgi:CHAD domain-containing protein